jgi:P2X purinoceptor 4
MLNIGSGIALLGIATVICDFLVLYIVKRRSYYKKNKFQMVKDKEALVRTFSYCLSSKYIPESF